MPQPVKLSDHLVLDARVTADATERSIAGQIEFWAGLGRAVEGLLRTDQLVALKQRGEVRSISSALAEVESEAGRARLSAHLASRPFPHFEPDPDVAGVVIKIDEDGTRTRGRFVNRTFQRADDR